MISYFILKMFVYDELISDLLIYGDALEKALAIIGTIVFTPVGILCFGLDIIATPIYLILGILTLIFKIIEIIKDKFGGVM